MYIRALYVGRFQPPHMGHVSAVERALTIARSVVIGVRMTPVDCKNPFTVDERVEMWREIIAWKGWHDIVEVIRVPDLPTKDMPVEDKQLDHPLVRWAETVARLARLSKAFDVVVASKPPIAVGFILAGYTVVPAFTEPQTRMRYSATEIRRRLAAGLSLEDLVPPPVERMLRLRKVRQPQC